jgi:indolepyruvate ferredoxin oxidoreductase
VFGYSRVRRLERQLITDYRVTVTEALAQLRPDNRELVAKIAALPDMIRGFEQVKLGNVERYRSELAALRADLSRPAAESAGVA